MTMINKIKDWIVNNKLKLAKAIVTMLATVLLVPAIVVVLAVAALIIVAAYPFILINNTRRAFAENKWVWEFTNKDEE